MIILSQWSPPQHTSSQVSSSFDDDSPVKESLKAYIMPGK
jgi:hypothetical protein